MIQSSDTIVITGCGGMLGEGVYEVFKNCCQVRASDIDLNVPWLEYLDVSDEKEVKKYLDDIKPDYIIHLAALTDMEYCELHPDEAKATNTRGVGNVSRYAIDHDIPFLYVSTAGVFDGTKDQYIESDAPHPLSIYGQTKYGGELIAATVPKHIIVRAGWMMGGGPVKDKKFINKIIKQIQTGVSEIAVVDDKLGTPCYTYDLAQVLKYLLGNNLNGVFHGVCDGGANRYEVARFLLDALGLGHKVKIRKVKSDYFKDSYFATRPRSEQLVNLRLKRVAPSLTRDWKDCLLEYLNKFDWKV